MSWKAKDAEKFKKGLDEKQAGKWARVANAVLKKCVAEGGDILQCEVLAIRKANSEFEEDKADLQRAPLAVLLDHTKDAIVSLAEINFAKDKDMEGFQLVLPIGLFVTFMYGDLIITRTFVDIMLENAKKKGIDKVFMDTGHDFAEANAWAVDMKTDEDGFYVKWEFTNLGRERITDKQYRFYSAAFGWDIDPETGEEWAPVLHAVSLTNHPVMSQLPAAHLDYGGIIPKSPEEWGKLIGQSTDIRDAVALALENLAHGDEGTGTREDRMELSNVLEFLGSVSDSDKNAIIGALGLSNVVQEHTTLTTANVEMKSQLETQATALTETKAKLDKIEEGVLSQRKATAIDKALKGGQIRPADKETWEKRFDESPEFTEKILLDLPKVLDYSAPTGDGSGGEEDGSKDETPLTSDVRKQIGLKPEGKKEEKKEE